MNSLDFHSLHRKRPPKRFPRTQVMRLPSRVWNDYSEAIKERIIDKWLEATQRIIIDRLQAIERMVTFERPGPMRTDAWPDEMSKQLVELSTEYDVIAKQSADIAAGTFQAVNGVSHSQWYAVAKRVMGVDLFSFEPWIESEMKTFVGINTDLITKIKSEVQSDVSRVVMAGFREGKRHETIAKELLSETDLGPGVFNKAETRAELVARDQTMKLYGDLGQKRQESAGLTLYIWRTLSDERVVGNPAGKYPHGSEGHHNHFIMDGKICKWSDPTVYADSIDEAIAGKWKPRTNDMPKVHPGVEIQDRCYAEPVFQTLFQ
jgi:uncharacterized protein with gpF-like domain